ncbi:hypothetical protein D3C85_1227390 [compost metagenome]
MGDEEQLSLLSFHQPKHIGVGVAFIQATLEWRVGQNHVEEVLFLPWVVFLDGFTQGVLIADVRAVHPVQHHVHAGNTEHRGVEVKSPEHLGIDMLAERFKQVASEVLVAVLVGENACLAGVHAVEVFHGAGKEARRAAGGVADHVCWLRGDQLDHGVDDVARSAELAIDAGGGELAQQVFVYIALHIALGQRQVVDHLHGRGQHGLVLDL